MTSKEDGLKLFYMTVLPQGEANGKVVVFYHGIQEHAARYQHAMERFATLGYKVIAMDMRGHGLSEGKRAYYKRFEVLLADATQFLDEIVLPTMDASKVFFWGQSFGGLMAPYMVLENKAKVSIRLTSCATFPPLTPSRLSRLAAWGQARGPVDDILGSTTPLSKKYNCRSDPLCQPYSPRLHSHR